MILFHDWCELNCPGSLSRLSRRAIKCANGFGYGSLITYVDRRLGGAKGYLASGYTFVRYTTPRFWWTDFLKRFDRFTVRADKKSGLTQARAAKERSVVRIWGCTNAVLILK